MKPPTGVLSWAVAMDPTSDLAKPGCPSLQILRDFNTGRLEEPALEEAVAEHLGSCGYCASRLSSLPKGTIIELLCAPDPLRQLFAAGQLNPDQLLAATESRRQAPTEGLEASCGAPGTDKLPVKIDHYFVIRELGRGGFGQVFLARDPQHSRLVAIKLPRPDRFATPQIREAFLAEARTVGLLDHPNIVPLYDCRELDDGRCIVVMKYVEGCTLHDLMKSERFDPKRSVELVAKMAEALQEAHKRNIWHRDVKPANILIDREGTPYLTDFGLAINEEQQHLHANEIAGTYPYMSPEQVRRGAAELDGRSDVWSLGVILYELLTRQRPFKGATNERLLHDIQLRPHRPLSSRDAKIASKLEAICDRCLKKSPDQRYPTAARLAEDLRAFLNQPRRTVVQLTVGLTLFTLLAGLAIAFVGSGNGPGDSSATGAGKTHGAVASPAPPEWADPDMVVWSPNNDQIDSHGYNEQRQRFEFDTLGPALFGVGKCMQEELTLKTRFRIHGVDGVGQAGVFWAWAPVTGNDRIDSCCWTIQVGRALSGVGFVLAVKQQDIGPSGGMHKVLKTRPVRDIPVKSPQTLVFDLKARVNGNELVEVVLNGVSLLDEPLQLEAALGREWRLLNDTRYGIFGQHGSFSVEAFSTQ